MELTPEQRAFRDAYIEARGYWVDFNDGLLRESPEWLSAYLAYSETPARDGPLSARLRELIYVAVDASTTHMFTEGLVLHIGIALRSGCTAADLIEVMQLATLQGLDSVAVGMAILSEEMATTGHPLPDDANSDLLDRYHALTGRRPHWLAHVAAMVPVYAEKLVVLLETGERKGRLSAHDRALIRLGLASSPTHLNREAMRTEVRAALAAGATADEMLQVFQLVAHLGIHACVDGVPAIMAASA